MILSSLPTTPRRWRSRTAVLATEGVSLASLHIFCDMVRLADTIMAERNAVMEGDFDPAGKLKGPLSLKILSVDGEPVRSAHGQMIEVDGRLADAGPLGLLILPSPAPMCERSFDDAPPGEAPLAPLLTEIWRDGAMIAAAGSSVVKLARAGILDSREATVGADLQDAFARSFPAVRLDRSRQITEDSNIFCASSLATEVVLACRLLSRLSANWVGEVAARVSLSHFLEADPGFFARAEPASNADVLVSRALFWIARNHSQPLRTTDLAAALSVSESTLVRRFQEVMRVTPHAYMRRLRLDAAARMLRSTDIPVARISTRIGYGDLQFFKTIFRRSYGASPIDYRRSMRGKY